MHQQNNFKLTPAVTDEFSLSIDGLSKFTQEIEKPAVSRYRLKRTIKLNADIKQFAEISEEPDKVRGDFKVRGIPFGAAGLLLAQARAASGKWKVTETPKAQQRYQAALIAELEKLKDTPSFQFLEPYVNNNQTYQYHEVNRTYLPQLVESLATLFVLLALDTGKDRPLQIAHLVAQFDAAVTNFLLDPKAGSLSVKTADVKKQMKRARSKSSFNGTQKMMRDLYAPTFKLPRADSDSTLYTDAATYRSKADALRGAHVYKAYGGTDDIDKRNALNEKRKNLKSSKLDLLKSFGDTCAGQVPAEVQAGSELFLAYMDWGAHTITPDNVAYLKRISAFLTLYARVLFPLKRVFVPREEDAESEFDTFRNIDSEDAGQYQFAFLKTILELEDPFLKNRFMSAAAQLHDEMYAFQNLVCELWEMSDEFQKSVQNADAVAFIQRVISKIDALGPFAQTIAVQLDINHTAADDANSQQWDVARLILRFFSQIAEYISAFFPLDTNSYLKTLQEGAQRFFGNVAVIRNQNLAQQKINQNSALDALQYFPFVVALLAMMLDKYEATVIDTICCKELEEYKKELDEKQKILSSLLSNQESRKIKEEISALVLHVSTGENPSQ